MVLEMKVECFEMSVQAHLEESVPSFGNNLNLLFIPLCLICDKCLTGMCLQTHIPISLSCLLYLLLIMLTCESKVVNKMPFFYQSWENWHVYLYFIFIKVHVDSWLSCVCVIYIRWTRKCDVLGWTPWKKRKTLSLCNFEHTDLHIGLVMNILQSIQEPLMEP